MRNIVVFIVVIINTFNSIIIKRKLIDTVDVRKRDGKESCRVQLSIPMISGQCAREILMSSGEGATTSSRYQDSWNVDEIEFSNGYRIVIVGIGRK